MNKDKRICLYTCITGDYDSLKELEFKEENIDYYCFTNNKKIKSDTWKVVYIEDSSLDNITLSRKIKILGHEIISKNYDLSVWLDGAFTIKKKVNDFLKKECDLKNYDFFVPLHHEWGDVFEEMIEVIKRGRESLENIQNLEAFYKRQDYQGTNGLYESGILVRKHNEKGVKETMKLWFSLFKEYSKRDQVTLPYALHCKNIKFCPIHINVFDNEYFEWHPHTPNKVDEKRYQVYWGSEKDLDTERITVGEYSLEGQSFTAELISPINTDEFKLQLPRTKGLLFRGLRINGENADKYMDIYNFINISDWLISNTDEPYIIVRKKLDKGGKIKLDLDFVVLKFSDYIGFLENLVREKEKREEELRIKEEKIRKLEEELRIKEENLISIVNSKSWKLLGVLRSAKARVLKIFNK